MMHSLVMPFVLSVANATIPVIPTLDPLAPPTSGIVAVENGTVYFVDSFSSTVWRALPGQAPAAFVTGRNGRTLQMDAEGNLFGTHEKAPGETVIWRADPAGRVSEVSTLDLPDEYGHAFVMNGESEVIGFTGGDRRSGVRLWRADGNGRSHVAGGEWGLRDGKAGEARFLPIGSMTRGAGGELLVTSGSSIRRIAADGRVSTISAGDRLLRQRHSLLARLAGIVQGHLTGIAQGGNGEIYVANAARGTIVRIDADGRAEDIVSSESGWSPTGVSTAGGYVYVLEYGAGVRVRRVAPGGASSVIARVKPDRAVAAAALGRLSEILT